MSKLSKSEPFNPGKPRAETAMEKTTRAANEILNEEKAQRERKTEHLRKARLEREAGESLEVDATASKAIPNKSEN